jgi:hypothetical protein
MDHCYHPFTERSEKNISDNLNASIDARVNYKIGLLPVSGW